MNVQDTFWFRRLECGSGPACKVATGELGQLIQVASHPCLSVTGGLPPLETLSNVTFALSILLGNSQHVSSLDSQRKWSLPKSCQDCVNITVLTFSNGIV